MKKFFSGILLCVCMAVALITGCGKKEAIPLFTDGEANFIIVRSADADNETINAAADLRQTIADNLGITVNHKPDSIAHKDGQLEVNIGITNRPDSQAVYGEVSNETETNGLDYIIKQKGDYIYIIGMSNRALQEAVDYFAEEFCSDAGGSVQKDYHYVYTYTGEEEKAFSINGDTDLAKYKIVTPKYNMSYLVGREVETLNDSLLVSNGVLLGQATDWDEEREYEIIIDQTERPGTPKTEDSDQYRIKVEGNKVYITGGSNEATAVAVKEFNKMVTEGGSVDEKTDITGSYAETVKDYEDYYAMTFHDEFDTMDRSIWHFYTGTNTMLSESDCNTDDPKNQWIEDGKLYMKTTKEGDHTNSVHVRTDNSTWFRYGLIEASVKMRQTSGQGGAFWLLGNTSQDYYAEIDIYEATMNAVKFTPLSWVSKSISGVNSGPYYCDFKGDVKTYEGGVAGDTYYRFENDDKEQYFHTYGIEWTDSYITGFIDGRTFIRIDTTFDERAVKTFNNFMQIIISQGALDSGGATKVNETTDWENNYSIFDYIRLYQTSNGEIRNR